jgi:hypothetical protein
MTAIDRDRAIRLLRAKSAELENIALDESDYDDWVAAADVAFIASLLADHLEQTP